MDDAEAQQQSDPLRWNGGSVLAMAGKECVAVAVDRRFGNVNALIHVAPRKTLVWENGMVAFTGLEGDVQDLAVELQTRIADKFARGLQRHIRTHVLSPRSMASLTSLVLYRNRQRPYFVEPIVVGLEPVGWTEEAEDINHHEVSTIDESLQLLTSLCQNNDCIQLDKPVGSEKPKRRLLFRPYLCGMDMIGAKSDSSRSFVCAGAAEKSLFGTAEAWWKPNLSESDLVKVIGGAFLSALERDCLSGYGAIIYLITSRGIIEYELAGRND
jgi:20S proteasome subunit beta 3